VRKGSEQMASEKTYQQLSQANLLGFQKRTENHRERLRWEEYATEMKKLYKMNSANSILTTINRQYDRMLQERILWDESKPEQGQENLNSNLLYLIAATDGYEDSVGHSQLVAKYSLMLTKLLGIKDKDFLVYLERGALLHDIGKIGIPEAILRKPGTLTVKERNIVEEHPEIGYKIIKNFEFLQKASRIVLYHHEHYDGEGYPFGLAGDSIPLEARIFALADTLDAITSDRPYRRGQSFRKARLEIERGKGTQFDPDVVDAFLSVSDDVWRKIREQNARTVTYVNPH
jgi:putative nucleotidyltransferase with HDIG domain